VDAWIVFHFFRTRVFLFVNPQTLFLGGLVVVSSTSFSWSSFIGAAAGWPLFLVFLQHFFDGRVVVVGLIVSASSLSSV